MLTRYASRHRIIADMVYAYHITSCTFNYVGVCTSNQGTQELVHVDCRRIPQEAKPGWAPGFRLPAGEKNCPTGLLAIERAKRRQ